jgi:hypothetical protein
VNGCMRVCESRHLHTYVHTHIHIHIPLRGDEEDLLRFTGQAEHLCGGHAAVETDVQDLCVCVYICVCMYVNRRKGGGVEMSAQMHTRVEG